MITYIKTIMVLTMIVYLGSILFWSLNQCLQEPTDPTQWDQWSRHAVFGVCIITAITVCIETIGAYAWFKVANGA